MRSLAVFTATVLALALAVGATPAAAQPGITSPILPPSAVDGPPPPLARSAKRPGSHRPGVALLLSFGATTATIVAASKGAFDGHERLGIAAAILAPAAGRWYIGEFGVIGIGARLAGIALLLQAVGGNGGSEASVTASIVLVVGSTCYDIVGSPISADRQNRRRWAAAPTALATSSGALAPGVGINGRF